LLSKFNIQTTPGKTNNFYIYVGDNIPDLSNFPIIQNELIWSDEMQADFDLWKLKEEEREYVEFKEFKEFQLYKLWKEETVSLQKKGK